MIRTLAALLIGLLPSTLPARDAHPCLLLTPAQAEAMRQRLKTDEPSRVALQTIRRELDALVDRPIDLPPRPGNWLHFYVCPKHGGNLKLGKQLEPWKWEHLCPIDGQVFPSDPTKASTDFDAVEYFRIHTTNARNVLWAGVAYQATGDKRYADFVRRMALAYADRCADYEANTLLHDKTFPGIVQWAGLDQAVWQIPMMQGVDCVWDTLSVEDRSAIGEKVFRAGAKKLVPQVRGIGNHQTWKNGAIGLTGYLLNDRELSEFAVRHPETGYFNQLARGVSADGQWFEGSWGYHNYTLNSLWPLVVAAGNAGDDLYTPAFKRMFDGPLAHALPTLALPMFNDTWPDGVQREMYPLAYARWLDDHYLPALPAPQKSPVLSLVFGVPDPATTQAAAQGERNSRTLASGYAILTRGAGRDATWLSVKYGPHGGGHGHPDKNSFILFSRGEVLMPDFGSINYASRLHKEWARSTLAHNTLSIDGKSQKFTEGKLLTFDDSLNGGRVQYASSHAGKIADGVDFVRTVILCDQDLLVVVDRVRSDAQHTYHLAAHHAGAWVDPPAGEPWSPPSGADAAYQWLQSPVRVAMDAPRRLVARSPGGRSTAFVLPPMDDAKLVITTGPDRDAVGRVPMFLIDKTARDATFAWAVRLGGDGSDVTFTARSEGDRTTVDVARGGEPLRLLVDSATGKVETAMRDNPARLEQKTPAPPLPPGGEVAFPAGKATTLELRDLPETQRRRVETTDPTLSGAFEVDVNKQGDVPWAFLLISDIDRPFKVGDVGLVTFWARNAFSNTGSARMAVAVEQSARPKPKFVDIPVTVGTTWQRVDVPFVVPRDYDAGGTLFNIRLGYAKQRVQFAGVKVINYGTSVKVEDLPRVATSYAGREADAPWRAEALARIEQIRKGDLAIRVVDADGRPVAGAKVRATLKRHAFGFGTCVSMTLLKDGRDADRYRQTLKTLFNHAVIENELKWPPIAQRGYDNPDKLVQWCLDNGLAVRGHVLVWPSEGRLPPEVVKLGDQPEKLAAAIVEHITRTVTRYRGKLIDWDVVNEPYAHHWAMDQLGGNDVMADWFRAAHATDPDVKLWINDYEILASGDMLDTPHQNHFFQTVQRLKELGAPVHGVGMQGHFGSNITSPQNMLKILDRFAALGVRIKVTELDIQLGDEALRSDFYRDLFITLFSHPSVDAIMQWGFWEGSHWIPPSALFARDWSLRPHGQVFLDLMKQWHTDATVATGADGTAQVRGFLGEYEVEATRPDGTTAKIAVTLPGEGASVQVQIK